MICSKVLTSSDQSLNDNDNSHSQDVSYLAIQQHASDCAVHFITSSFDNSVIKWEWNQGEQKIIYRNRIVNAHHDDILCIELAPNNKYFVTTCYDTTIRKWDTIFNPQQMPILTFTDFTGNEKGLKHLAAVSRCAVSKDSSFMISVSLDKSAIIWDCKEMNRTSLLRKLPNLHSKGITSVEISIDMTWFVTTAKAREVKLWNVAPGNEETTVKGHKDEEV